MNPWTSRLQHSLLTHPLTLTHLHSLVLHLIQNYYSPLSRTPHLHHLTHPLTRLHSLVLHLHLIQNYCRTPHLPHLIPHLSPASYVHQKDQGYDYDEMNQVFLVGICLLLYFVVGQQPMQHCHIAAYQLVQSSSSSSCLYYLSSPDLEVPVRGGRIFRGERRGIFGFRRGERRRGAPFSASDCLSLPDISYHYYQDIFR